MPDLITFEQAIEETDIRDRLILLGNGFSIAQAGGTFSYSALLDKSELPADSSARNIFSIFNTFDFEEVVNALESASKVVEAYGDSESASHFLAEANYIRESLIVAVHNVHPGIRFDIPQHQIEACGNFLRNFSTIFTLNYDLLLYWVNISIRGHTDGFGLGPVENGFRTFNANAHCDTFYLHGALHLFPGSRGETKKRILINSTIIQDIENTIRGDNIFPIFIAEGESIKKIKKISTIPYLRLAYEKLQTSTGSAFIFGHSASAVDRHIYDALYKMSDIYFCVYEPSLNLARIHAQLSNFFSSAPRTNLHYIDAATVHPWG